jgi:hypothetical protein
MSKKHPAETRETVRLMAKQLWDYEKAYGRPFNELAPTDGHLGGLTFRGCTFKSTPEGLHRDRYLGEPVDLLFTEADLSK